MCRCDECWQLKKLSKISDLISATYFSVLSLGSVSSLIDKHLRSYLFNVLSCFTVQPKRSTLSPAITTEFAHFRIAASDGDTDYF